MIAVVSMAVAPLTARLASEWVPPTTPPKLALPETVSDRAVAVDEFSVLPKPMVPAVVEVSVVFAPSVAAPA